MRWSRNLQPDCPEPSDGGDGLDCGRPEAAEVDVRRKARSDQVVEFAFADAVRSDKEHVMEIRAPAAAEVVDVTTRLRADSSCVLAPTVPLQVKCDLAIRQQIATTPSRWLAAVTLARR